MLWQHCASYEISFLANAICIFFFKNVLTLTWWWPCKVDTRSYIDITKILLCSTVICLFILYLHLLFVKHQRLHITKYFRCILIKYNLNYTCVCFKTSDSSVSIFNMLQLRGGNFLSATTSRLAVGPTRPPNQMGIALSQAKSSHMWSRPRSSIYYRG
jgi:hypothetical protein